MISGYAVTWKRKPIALPFLIDVDSVDLAAEIAIKLHNVPHVYEVKITTLDGAEMDAETKAAIWKRIEDRKGMEWALGIST